ncbi:MAG: response regulator [Bacteroidetes bacterium]|nr:response regulator [Bacteroidota bacterium]
MIGLFAIDDHFLIIEGLGRAFNAETDEVGLVGSANCVEDAIKKIPATQTDVIVLDLFIGDSDPVANFRQLRNAFPSIPIVILTMEDSLRWQVKMFKLGVMGFLNKAEKKDTLKSVFIQVALGNLVMPDKVSQTLISKTVYPK